MREYMKITSERRSMENLNERVFNQENKKSKRCIYLYTYIHYTYIVLQGQETRRNNKK